jgi:hypothetical protein
LNAVFKEAAAGPAADPTPVYWDPFKIPGGKPVTAVPGLTPRSPVTVVALVLVTVDPASTANPPADPSATGVWHGHAEVAKFQTRSAAKEDPAWLLTLVVMVAVKAVLGAKSGDGVKVAAFFAASYVTVPLTGVAAAPAPTLKLVELMVDASIASLKVALSVLFVQTPEERAVGVTLGVEKVAPGLPDVSPNSTSFPPQAISDDAKMTSA